MLSFKRVELNQGIIFMLGWDYINLKWLNKFRVVMMFLIFGLVGINGIEVVLIYIVCLIMF